MTKKGMPKWIWGVLCSLAVAIMVVAWRVYNSGFKLQNTTYLYVDADDNVDSISQKIESQTAPESMRVFHLFAGLLNLKDRIRTGRYEVSPQHTMLNLIRDIRNHHEKPIMLVVPSTRTMDAMAGKLANQLMRFFFNLSICRNPIIVSNSHTLIATSCYNTIVNLRLHLGSNGNYDVPILMQCKEECDRFKRIV